jgi:hypothetical protein
MISGREAPAAPTIFFADGSRIAGAIDAKTLEQKFFSTLK